MLEKGEKLTMLGEKTAKAFARQLDIKTTGELLQHYPRRYLKRGELTRIADLPVGEIATVVGEIVSVSARYIKGRGGHILEATISDGTSLLSLAFFGQAWRKDELTKGRRGFFSGKVGLFSGKLQLAHPDYELFDEISDAEAKAWAELPISVYPATSTLPSWRIEKAIRQVLGQSEIKEVIPKEILDKEKLIGLSQAIQKIHQPTKDADYVQAIESLKFHEALLLQLGLIQKRISYAGDAAAVLDDVSRALEFEKHLDFSFTDSQLRVNSEIEQDLASGRPMHRLLQGEVGSGKTVVALRAVMLAVAKNQQSVLLAPTEVLAEQHFQSITKILGPELSRELGVRLVTGSLSAAERKKSLLDLASGKCLLAIGTHALFAEKIQFAELSLVVIDEQHRFGVMQREAIKEKGKKTPHVLTMTATPIPRTIAITAFGDLDVSTLRELPKGRKPIETFVVPVENAALVSRVWQRVSEEVAKGRQAFVVCPRIDGKEYEDNLQELGKVPAAAATEVFASLQKNPALSGLRIGLMHGRLSSEEKQSAMASFAAGETDVLVATTVIEVGVNVPNATTMVVLDADRFGISQLHQLRGRVGRGNESGICLLVSASEDGSLASQRLSALAQTTDGFKLSELDLELRGEGDVLGENQAGTKSQLRLLKVTKDAKLLERSRLLAKEILQRDVPAQLQHGIELMRIGALSSS
ncbi:MAG: ATP-dependent DNA helicase RecG [Aquiluna sp.]